MGKLNYFKNKPKATKIDVASYLQRINEKREEPSIAYLRRLHRSHLLHIPFENLDIHYDRKIALDYKAVFRKVISGKRGGYCYELNGLFYHLLYHLGFDCRIISARVKNEASGEFGKEYDHMALVITLSGEDYLADVGFGKGIIYPKKITPDVVQMDYTDYWKITKDADENFLLQVSKDAQSFSTRYLFSDQPKEIIQFHEMNEYQQTNPESTFVKKKVISRLTESGRVTLSSNKFHELKLGVQAETNVGSEDEFLSLLEQHFGITFRQLMPLKN